jgi:hypothetical protein
MRSEAVGPEHPSGFDGAGLPAQIRRDFPTAERIGVDLVEQARKLAAN